MTLREKLLADSKHYCDWRGISLARLATIVVNNGNFFRRLEQGGDCTTGVYERFQRYFADHGPDPEAATSNGSDPTQDAA